MNAKRRKRTPAAGTPPTDPIVGLAGSIAHDFSNLLMVIRNAASLLRGELGANERGQAIVEEVIHAADRATKLTRQLQAIGRAQLLRPDLVKPAEVMRGIRDVLREIVPTDVEFGMAIAATDASVRFDASQLPIAVMNLVSYAADSIESHGRVQLALREETIDKKAARQRKLRAGRFISIRVARSGAPTVGEAKGRFGPRLAGRDLPHGTDLRLASAHGVVVQSGGMMDIAADARHGTSFIIYLPIVDDPDAAEPKPRRPLQVIRSLAGTEVILVVEDDQALRGMVRASLELYGYTVLEAANGEEALRLLALYNASPDLLLTDLVMPHVTGRELIEALSMEGRLPKVLIMSGYTDHQVLQRAGPGDSFPFLRKPFTHEELAAKLRTLFDN